MSVLKSTAAVAAVIAIATSGWVAYVLQCSNVSKLQLERAAWKQKAGKAYTLMLKAQGGGSPDVVVIPKGATFDCVDVAGGGRKCDMATIYPPEGF